MAVTDRYLTSVQTELTSRIDTKNASVGQEVAARTKETAKLADGTTLPKGTRLVGRITRVAAQDKAGGGGSLLSMTFDHAELKGGQTVQLRSVIQTVAPAAGLSSNVGTQSMAPIELMGGGVSSASTRGGLGSGGLGGGGVLGGPMRPAAQTPGSIGVNDPAAGSIGGAAGPVDQTTDSIGSIGQTTGTTRGRAANDAGAGIGPVSHTTIAPVAQAGESVSNSNGSRATGLPGVLLNTTDSAYSSGTLFAPGRNLTLESGTQITLGVITR
jgi:hypothetical protein